MPSFVAVNSFGFAQKSFVADSLEDAEAISGMRCVVSLAVPAGWKRHEETGEFRPLSPFKSWLWDAETATWVAPEPRPDGDFIWDEESLSWIERPVAIEPTPLPVEEEPNA